MAYVLWLLIMCQKFSIIFSYVDEESPINYSGHKILSISTHTDEMKRHVVNLQNRYQDGVKFWEHDFLIGDEVSLLVSKEHAKPFENKMKEFNFTYRIVCEDLGKLIRLERSSPRNMTLEEFGYNYGKHNNFPTIQNYLLHATKKNSNISKLSVIGNSFEKRPIYSVQIPRYRRNNKLAIVIECGIHAREWTSVEACIYMIKKFIEPDENDTSVKFILSTYDIIIMPLINPDGYVYSWIKNRMWRKTTSCYKEKCEGECFGVDGNRNFYVGLCEHDDCTQDPCLETYAGEKPFSEPETIAVRDVIRKLGNRLFAYFSFHSSGPMWLIPYGKTKDFPKNYDEMKRVADIGTAAIEKANGIEFETGTAARLLYKCVGTSMDYAYDQGRATYSYTIELRKGKQMHGFILHEKEIIPMCKETFEGLKAGIVALNRNELLK